MPSVALDIIIFPFPFITSQGRCLEKEGEGPWQSGFDRGSRAPECYGVRKLWTQLWEWLGCEGSEWGGGDGVGSAGGALAGQCLPLSEGAGRGCSAHPGPAWCLACEGRLSWPWHGGKRGHTGALGACPPASCHMQSCGQP